MSIRIDKSDLAALLTKRLVDDEPDLTMLCSLALEYHGFKVNTFNDPQRALSNYKPSYYDLVILDITMPKMDGFQLYDEIKKKDSTLML